MIRWVPCILMLAMLGPGRALAAPCSIGTLATYVGLGSGGCDVPSSPTIILKDFAFSSSTLAGSPTLLTDASITVTPSTLANAFLLDFSAAGFSVGAGDAAGYTIEYTVDPPPPIIHGFRLRMFAFSPVAPGFADITTDLCVGAAFSGLSCSGTPLSLSVTDDGITPMLSALLLYTPSSVVGVRNKITLDASAGGSADFSSFSNEVQTLPEPSAAWLILGGLAALAALGRLRAKARQVGLDLGL